MNKPYKTTGGVFPAFYKTITDSGHILIAGATGSGKSVLISNILKYLTATKPPSNCGLVLLDPKRVELRDWLQYPHCTAYADTIPRIEKTLFKCERTQQSRFHEMQRRHLKRYENGDIYIIVDELADLLLSSKAAAGYLSSLAMLSRAAGFHIIAGTQRPTRDIITPMISVNFIHKIALHTNSKQDSRNIIGVTGAEELPYFGYGLLQTPGKALTQIKIDIL